MIRNLIFQATAFDFNKVDMAFINGHVLENFGKKAGGILEDLHDWAKFRACGPEVKVYLDARASYEQESLASVAEEIVLTAADHDVVFFKMERHLKEHISLKPEGKSVLFESSEEAVAAIDTAIEYYNNHTDRVHRGLFHSLRPILTKAVGKSISVMASPFENPFLFTFFFEEGDYYYVLEMTVEPEVMFGENYSKEG